MSNVSSFELSKTDWKFLNNNNIVKGVGNGFADVTEFAESQLCIVGSKITYIETKKGIFGVRYMSGCFYPVWSKFFGIPKGKNYYKFENNEFKRLKNE